jgi:hypothetical protein
MVELFKHWDAGGVVMKVLTAAMLSAGLALSCAAQASGEKACKVSGDKDCFTGSFGLVDIPGESQHKLLAADFGYVDSSGAGWETKKGAKTDGASIPSLLKPFIGSAWEDGYIRAAVIHDWYCDRHVRSWKDTHMVFYDAMLASGLERQKAKLMFYAVYTFGPRWGYLVPGTPCKGTDACINNTQKTVFMTTPGKLDDVSKVAELKLVEAMINVTASKGELSLEDLMKMADKTHPQQDLVAANPDAAATQ